MNIDEIRDRLHRLSLSTTSAESLALIAKLADGVPDLLAEIERLTAIVGKLPTNAEGAPVSPGDMVFHPAERHGWVAWDFYQHRIDGKPVEWLIRVFDRQDGRPLRIAECYSTPGGALAARAEAKGGVE